MRAILIMHELDIVIVLGANIPPKRVFASTYLEVCLLLSIF